MIRNAYDISYSYFSSKENGWLGLHVIQGLPPEFSLAMPIFVCHCFSSVIPFLIKPQFCFCICIMHMNCGNPVSCILMILNIFPIVMYVLDTWVISVTFPF